MTGADGVGAGELPLEIARRSIRGSLTLVAANLGSAGINTLTLILVSRLLGPAGYGVYSLAFVIPNLLQLFVGFGVTTSIIRYSAYYSSIGRPDEAQRFTKNAILFLLLFGLIMTSLSFALSGPLSQLILRREELGPYVELASFNVFGATALQAASSAAVGWNKMSLYSLVQVLQSIVKLAASPLLIIVGFGVAGSAVGQVMSFIGAGIAGILVIYSSDLRNSKAKPGPGFFSDVREMLSFGVPAYVGILFSSLATYYVAIVLASVATNTVFGYFQAAQNFIAPINLASSALVSALFPAFTSMDATGGDPQVGFRQAFKFVTYLLTPFAVFLATASGVLIPFFYGNSFATSAGYLTLLAVAYIPMAYGYGVYPALFNGFDRTRLTMLFYLSSSLVLGTAATLFSVEGNLGVNGLIYAILLSNLVGWAMGAFFSRRYLGVFPDARAGVAVLVVCALSSAAVLVTPPVSNSGALTFLSYLVIFFLVYITLTPLLGVINDKDVGLMRHTFGGLGLFGHLVELLLRYEEYLIGLGNRKR